MRRPRRVAIVLQTRFGSTRLPGKAMRSLAGQSLLEHCIARLTRAAVGPVVVATTTLEEDDQIVARARDLGANVFRGAEDDVLRRVVEAAASVEADIIVRATGDNPAVDVDAACRTIQALESHNAEYVVERGLPCGAAVETMTRAAIERADRIAEAFADREHVTPLVRRSPQLFRAVQPLAPPVLCRPDVRLTVDTPSDLSYMHSVLLRAGTPSGVVSLRRIIAAADDIARLAPTRPQRDERRGDTGGTATGPMPV